ncbi:MAG: hypothetical protein KA714_27855 [Limnoraphis sp. WC205]|jgi:hypothetical protein|nr:hypothetical protein [Limnoraphis sp. WC205]
MTTPKINPSSSLSSPEDNAVPQTSTPKLEAETATMTVTPTKHSLKLPKGFWGWQLLWLTVLLGFGTMGAGALLWLLITPPPPNCEEISPISPDGDRLYCADQGAKSGELEKIQAAFNLIETWPETHPLQPQAQKMMEQWAKLLIALADQKIDEGNLQGAIDLISIVPKTSPAYSTVESAITGWQNDWDEGQQLYKKAIAALKQQNWAQAFSHIQSLTKLNNAHWREKRFNELVDRMSIERQGDKRLQEAREIAKQDSPSSLEEAIDLAHRVDSKLYIYSVAKQEVKNWSQRLVDLATQELKAKNRSNVISIAQRVPEYSPLYQDAQNLMLLATVQDVSLNQASSKPFLEKLVVLLEGKAAVEKGSIKQALYQEANIPPDQLGGQIQDLIDLQLANAIAKIGHPFALQLAMDQAQTLSPNRPRRIHAQTLVAHWRKEIERIEDRPHIVLARKLAEQEDANGFRAAVKQATQVALGRPLRVEAQTLIAEWTKRIEIIEDQPIFNEALALAKAGNLSAAIDKASGIASGRALHSQARDKINEWVTEVQIAEDRPLLDKAYGLADKGSLSSAISEASRIRYGRALYYEAQNAIARWVEERDAYWAAQQPRRSEPTSSRSSSSSSQSSYSSSGSSSSSSSSSGYSSGSSSTSGYSDYSGGYSSGSSSGYSGSYSGSTSGYSDSSSGGYSSGSSGYSGGYSSGGYSSGYSSDYSGSSSGYSDSYSGGYSGGSSGYSSSDSVAPAPAAASGGYEAPAAAPEAPAAAPTESYSPPDANLFLE